MYACETHITHVPVYIKYVCQTTVGNGVKHVVVHTKKNVRCMVVYNYTPVLCVVANTGYYVRRSVFFLNTQRDMPYSKVKFFLGTINVGVKMPYARNILT